MPIRNLTILCIAMVFSLLCYKQAVRNHYASMIGESLQIIQEEYVEEVDSEQLFEDAMKGMVSGLDDYSSFIVQSDFAQFQESLDQEFGGIGIMVEIPPESDRITIISPVVDTPAFREGLRAGDVIYEIDGNDTTDMSLKESVKLMRGPIGEPIDLKIRHAGSQKLADYSIERAVIPIDSVLGDTREVGGDWNFYLEKQPNIGFIRLTSFGEMTADELRGALRQYETHPVDAIILDVRNNAGGLLGTAVELCDMFVPGGKIVSTRGRDGKERDAYYAREGVEIPADLPMAILINGFSASASEILAACLQDHNRAIVVGERSFGKGTVQNVISMQGGRSALKLTTASYWRPSGRNIHRREDATEEDEWGVKPDTDCVVKLTEEQFTEVLKIRRQRDVVLVGDEEHDRLPPLEEWTEPQPDPQVQRAVELLLQQLQIELDTRDQTAA